MHIHGVQGDDLHIPCEMVTTISLMYPSPHIATVFL